MPLVLTLRQAIPVRWQTPDLLPEKLAGKSTDELARLPVYVGAIPVALAHLFDISGCCEGGDVELEGDFSLLDGLGSDMTSGTMRIRGSVGHRLGANMAGGEIQLHGDAAAGVGLGMRGGTIRVNGNVGDHAGGRPSNQRIGMKGGALFIHGAAGDYLGAGMRRGVIAVEKTAGDCLGFGMLAGTILVFGRAGAFAGANMKRGTIALLGNGPNSLAATFHQGSISEPRFMRLLGVWLARNEFPLGSQLLDAPLRQYHGDSAKSIRGEVFVLASRKPAD